MAKAVWNNPYVRWHYVDGDYSLTPHAFITSGGAMELRNEFMALQKRDHVIMCGLG